MTKLTVLVDASGHWTDISEKDSAGEPRYNADGSIQLKSHVRWGADNITIGRIPGGMSDNQGSSVAIRLDFEDGSVAIGQCSMKHFLIAANAMYAAEEGGGIAFPTVGPPQ